MLFRLLAIPNLRVFVNAPLARYNRFEIGGPARALLDAADETALAQAWRTLRDYGWPHQVIGGAPTLSSTTPASPGRFCATRRTPSVSREPLSRPARGRFFKTWSMRRSTADCGGWRR